MGKKCLRCNELLPSSRCKVNHDFLADYHAGKNAFEEKPVTFTNLGEIRRYDITFAQHLHDYCFYDSEKLVDDFLFNVKNRVGRSNNYFLMKCGFSMENIQPPLFENEQPIRNSRYWSTELQQTKLFNDFICFKLRAEALKRVINNGMSGSLWHFNRFLYINVKILDTGNQLFR